MVWMRLVRIALAAVVCAALVGATHGSVRASLLAPRTATVGLRVTVVVTVTSTPRSVVVVAARGAVRMPVATAKSGTRWRARVVFPGPGRWTLTARVAGKAVASRFVTVVEPSVRHPYAVVVDPRG